jgi:hypothetical protein
VSGRAEPWGHLARRFVGALRPGGPSDADRAWVEAVLEPEEYALWVRQPAQDRRHTVEVARRVEAALADGPHAGDPRWPGCALLHDIGKLASGLGVLNRVVATVAERATGGALAARGTGGVPPTTAAEAALKGEEHRGLRRRIALYVRHPEIGADMIRMAGGRPEIAHWAGAHHDRARLDPTLLPAPVVIALVAADND